MTATYLKYSAFPLNGADDSFGDGTTPNAGWYGASEATTAIITQIQNPNPLHGGFGPPQMIAQSTPDDVVTLGLAEAYRTNPTQIRATSSTATDIQTETGVIRAGHSAGSPLEPIYATTEMQTNAFMVQDGPQSIANGSQSNNAARDATNFDYALGTSGTDTIVQEIDKGYVFTLTDKVVAANGHVDTNLALHLIVDSATASGTAWATANGTPFIIDDGHHGQSIMNSENGAFFSPDMGARTETITLTATAPGSTVPLIGVQDIIHHVDHAMI